MNWQFCVAMACVIGSAACGDDDAPAVDGGPADSGDTTDLGVDDLGPSDLGPDDLGPDDLGPSDLGPADAGTSCEGPPGLYVAGSCTELAPGVRRFTPQYRLWTDGADKERFVYLPAATQIDTSLPDAWAYPMGTKLWKTFSLGGVRLETRLLEKTGAGIGAAAWSMRAFAWNAAQDAVTEVPAGGMTDVLGTQHDIPSHSSCLRCHTGATRDVSLGFSAIQLNHAGTDVSLQTLLDESLLSAPIDPSVAVIPGSVTAQTALGYLHANCGHCHGGAGASAGMRLWVNVGLATVEETDTWLTAVDYASGWAATLPPTITARIEPGMSMGSSVLRRQELRGSVATPGDYGNQMPQLGTEQVDTLGVEAVRVWIDSLPPTP